MNVGSEYTPVSVSDDNNLAAPLTEIRLTGGSGTTFEPLEIADNALPSLSHVESKPKVKSSSFVGIAFLGMIVIIGSMLRQHQQQQPGASVPPSQNNAAPDDDWRSFNKEIAPEEDGFIDPKYADGQTINPADIPVHPYVHPLVKDLEYYHDHSGQETRPYSLLMLQDVEGMCLRSDDAGVEGFLQKHVVNFDFIYKSCEYDETHKEQFRKVTLSYFGTHSPFNEILAERMQGLPQVHRQKMLRFETVAVVHQDVEFDDDTYILWQEGKATWQLRCDEMPWEECIALGTDHLREMEPDEFINALQHGG